MGIREECVEAMFVGHIDPLNEIMECACADDPDTDGLTASFKGQICYDSTNDNWYINTGDATTWTKVNY